MGWLGEADINRKFKGFSMPGENRQLSIYNGICDIMEYAGGDDYVFIHDAARPFLSGNMVTECVTSVNGHDGVVPVLPMKDTVYLSDNGRVISTLLKREAVFAGQAPELFVLGKYIEANRRLLPNDILKINGSTEPAVMAGMDIAMIPGDEGNFKITTKADLERMRTVVHECVGTA
jgi:2-C-methyl-D-erythritol 4-phosphate cytidylyltransferase